MSVSNASTLDAASDALHLPVLRERCVELFAHVADKTAVVIDGTLGMGGHTEALLATYPALRVIGIDRDPQAIELATKRLASFGQRFQAVNTTYDQIDAVIEQQIGKEAKVAGVLLDLGVSSLQLDQVERGFSYAVDAPLDMRMNAHSGITAQELLNTASVAHLRKIIATYGEERFAGQIAQKIVAYREVKPLTRTSELVEIVRSALPAAAMRTGGNPAKRTFQAIRIAVNEELTILETALAKAVEAVEVGGRVVVESYHSLEDRLVKNAFAKGLRSTTPAGLPVELADHQPYLRDLTRGAEKADAAELARNTRSASVRLRAVERVRETPAHLVPDFSKPLPQTQSLKGVRK